MGMQLGIGVPVWIGWVPEDQTSAIFDGRCKKGVICDGPFKPNTKVRNGYTGERRILGGSENRWNVALDEGGQVSAAESILFPVDDDGEKARRCHQSTPETLVR